MSSRLLVLLVPVDRRRQWTPERGVRIPRYPFAGDMSEVQWLRIVSMATRLASKKFCREGGSSPTDRGRCVGPASAPPQGHHGQARPGCLQASLWAPLGSPRVCSGPWMLMTHFTEALVWVRMKICKGGPLWTSCHLRWKMLCCLHTITIWDYKQWFN